MAISDIIPWRSRQRELARRKDPFTYLHREIDRLFNEACFSPRWPTLMPQVEVNETDAEIEICAELAGIEPKDVEIDASEDELTIRGEKRSESSEEGKGKGHHWTERSYGSFERTIALPAEVDAEKSKASFKNGVLRIKLQNEKEVSDAREKSILRHRLELCAFSQAMRIDCSFPRGGFATTTEPARAVELEHFYFGSRK
jgi:HSP20 family protein